MQADELTVWLDHNAGVLFSSSEEILAKQTLNGDVKYFVSDALSQAGAHVDRLAQGQSKVIEDRELLTGQQPFSSHALADAFVAKLAAHRARVAR